MADRILRNFINGEYVEARADDSFEVIDPATEQSYASSPVSGQADVDAAFAAAAAAFEGWGESTPAERQLAYRRVRQELDGLIALSDEAIEVLESRVSQELTRGETPAGGGAAPSAQTSAIWPVPARDPRPGDGAPRGA